MVGRRVVLTGACGGIGKAIATLLHDKGFFLVLVGRNASDLSALSTELPNSSYVVCDFSSDEGLKPLFDEIRDNPPDVLINNAGVTADGLLIRMSNDEWDKVLRVNLTVPFMLCRATMREMFRRRSGVIVNISSVIGVMGNIGQGNYAASKAGLIALTKCIAKEGASRGIRANCVAPGMIKTPMTDDLSDDIKQKICDNVPLNRFGIPKDVAHTVLYLVDSEYVTGDVLHVNGGLFM